MAFPIESEAEQRDYRQMLLEADMQDILETTRNLVAGTMDFLTNELMQCVQVATSHVVRVPRDSPERDSVLTTYCVVVMDVYTRFMWVRPLRVNETCHSVSTHSQILDHVLAVCTEFGMPQQIRVDMGQVTRYLASFDQRVKEVCAVMRCAPPTVVDAGDKSTSTGNRVESAHALATAMRKECDRQNQHLPENAHILCHLVAGQYNRTFQEAVGASPYDAMFRGRTAQTTRGVEFSTPTNRRKRDHSVAHLTGADVHTAARMRLNLDGVV